MRTAEDILTDYVNRGYSFERLRLIARERPEPLRGELLKRIEAMAEAALSRKGAKPDSVFMVLTEEDEDMGPIVDFGSLGAKAEKPAETAADDAVLTKAVEEDSGVAEVTAEAASEAAVAAVYAAEEELSNATVEFGVDEIAELAVATPAPAPTPTSSLDLDAEEPEEVAATVLELLNNSQVEGLQPEMVEVAVEEAETLPEAAEPVTAEGVAEISAPFGVEGVEEVSAAVVCQAEALPARLPGPPFVFSLLFQELDGEDPEPGPDNPTDQATKKRGQDESRKEEAAASPEAPTPADPEPVEATWLAKQGLPVEGPSFAPAMEAATPDEKEIHATPSPVKPVWLSILESEVLAVFDEQPDAPGEETEPLPMALASPFTVVEPEKPLWQIPDEEPASPGEIVPAQNLEPDAPSMRESVEITVSEAGSETEEATTLSSSHLRIIETNHDPSDRVIALRPAYGRKKQPRWVMRAEDVSGPGREMPETSADNAGDSTPATAIEGTEDSAAEELVAAVNRDSVVFPDPTPVPTPAEEVFVANEPPAVVAVAASSAPATTVAMREEQGLAPVQWEAELSVLRRGLAEIEDLVRLKEMEKGELARLLNARDETLRIQNDELSRIRDLVAAQSRQVEEYYAVRADNETLQNDLSRMTERYDEMRNEYVPALREEVSSLSGRLEELGSVESRLRRDLRGARRRVGVGYALSAVAAVLLVLMPTFYAFRGENGPTQEELRAQAELASRAALLEEENTRLMQRASGLQRDHDITLARAGERVRELQSAIEGFKKSDAEYRAVAYKNEQRLRAEIERLRGEQLLTLQGPASGELPRNAVRDPRGEINQTFQANSGRRATQGDAGMANRQPLPAPGGNQAPRVAMVLQGEGLSHVLQREYGRYDPALVEWIARENRLPRDRKGNPMLQPGQELRLPPAAPASAQAGRR